MREQIYGTVSPVKVSPPIYRALPTRKWCNHSIPSSIETKWSFLLRKMTNLDVICRDSGISREVKNPLSNKPHWRSSPFLFPKPSILRPPCLSEKFIIVKNESAKTFSHNNHFYLSDNKSVL